MLDLLYSVRDWVFLLQFGLPIALGVWAIWRMRRPPVAARSDRPAAVGMAITLAIFCATVGTLVMSEFAGMFSGHPNYATGLLIGVGAAIVLPLGCLAGYTLLATRGLGRVAWLGFILGPPVLIAGPLVIYGQLINLASS